VLFELADGESVGTASVRGGAGPNPGPVSPLAEVEGEDDTTVASLVDRWWYCGCPPREAPGAAEAEPPPVAVDRWATTHIPTHARHRPPSAAMLDTPTYQGIGAASGQNAGGPGSRPSSAAGRSSTGGGGNGARRRPSSAASSSSSSRNQRPPHLVRKDREYFTNLFKNVDTDGSGGLTLPELVDWLGMQGQKVTFAVVRASLQKLGHPGDNNTNLTAEVFVEYVT